jgi:hypothetical protein
VRHFQYQECVRDCDEAARRGREFRADNKLLAKALSRKASALLELAGCAGDYAPAIRALQQSLAEHYSDETLDKLGKAESRMKQMEAQERLDQAADHHRERGMGLWALLDHGIVPLLNLEMRKARYTEGSHVSGHQKRNASRVDMTP